MKKIVLHAVAVALAFSLSSFGLTSVAEAKAKPAKTHTTARVKKARTPKAPKAAKAKAPKRAKAKRTSKATP